MFQTKYSDPNFELSTHKHRLTKCRKPGSCKIFRAWLRFLTEHTFFFFLNLICCPNFHSCWVKAFGNAK